MVASIVVVVVAPHIPMVWLTVWWLLLSAATAYRFWYAKRSLETANAKQSTRSLSIHFCTGVAVTGIIWGLGFFVGAGHLSIEIRAMLVMVIAGIGAGGVIASYGIAHHFYGFMIPALGIPAVYGLFDGGRIQLWMSVLVIMFIVALLLTFLRYARAVRELIDTRLENAILVDTLTDSNRNLEQTNEQLLELSSTDGLTQIANRRHFDNQLQREWGRAQRSRSILSYLMVDLDFFKPYNDHYGHLKGDDCLKEVAQAMERVLRRPGDFVGRYGGEEFAIISPDTPLEGAKILAENVREIVASLKIPHAGSPASEHVTVSIGVSATVPTADTSVDDLIRAADEALYQAKRRGRNCVQIGDFVPGAQGRG